MTIAARPISAEQQWRVRINSALNLEGLPSSQDLISDPENSHTTPHTCRLWDIPNAYITTPFSPHCTEKDVWGRWALSLCHSATRINSSDGKLGAVVSNLFWNQESVKQLNNIVTTVLI